MVFRRPELEKDNPIAPQPYVGPRRRLAPDRASASREFTEENDLKKTLQVLALAASRYVDRVPKTRKTEKSLKYCGMSLHKPSECWPPKTAEEPGLSRMGKAEDCGLCIS